MYKITKYRWYLRVNKIDKIIDFVLDGYNYFLFQIQRIKDCICIGYNT